MQGELRGNLTSGTSHDFVNLNLSRAFESGTTSLKNTAFT